MSRLVDRLHDDAFQGYAYAYPHKTAYRSLAPPQPLDDVWRDEDKSALFLYVHIPFCAMRCGFCNLFTAARPQAEQVAATLDAIESQSRVVSRQIEPQRIAQAAFGGGTPSFLTESELERVFAFLSSHWPIAFGQVPLSFETSPETLTAGKTALLKASGVTRLSMGVQSFVGRDLKALGRPQRNEDVEAACRQIVDADFETFNLDLIYGAPGQRVEDWDASLARTLSWQPDEVYLYPLYVRELTGLGRTGKEAALHRQSLYRHGRMRLLEAGYHQRSMRLFQRASVPSSWDEIDADFACQDDGMIGLGPGARSYTRALHYSSEYAVKATRVRGIIDEFNERDGRAFAEATHGATLDADEQRRRYLIKSLLRLPGLDCRAYEARFGASVFSHFPALEELHALELCTFDNDYMRLTPEGLAYSDAIGPWLYSEAVTRTMQHYEAV